MDQKEINKKTLLNVSFYYIELQVFPQQNLIKNFSSFVATSSNIFLQCCGHFPPCYMPRPLADMTPQLGPAHHHPHHLHHHHERRRHLWM